VQINTNQFQSASDDRWTAKNNIGQAKIFPHHLEKRKGAEMMICCALEKKNAKEIILRALQEKGKHPEWCYPNLTPGADPICSKRIATIWQVALRKGFFEKSCLLHSILRSSLTC